MNNRRIQFDLILPAILIAFGLITAVVIFTGVLPGVRAVLVFLFLLIAPGLAFVRLLPAEDVMTLVTLAVALSLAIDTVIAMILLYAGMWSFPTVFAIIAAISLVGAVLQLRPASIGRVEEKER